MTKTEVQPQTLIDAAGSHLHRPNHSSITHVRGKPLPRPVTPNPPRRPRAPERRSPSDVKGSPKSVPVAKESREKSQRVDIKSAADLKISRRGGHGDMNVVKRELSLTEGIFKRCKDSAGKAEFRSIAYVCGFPLCAAEALRLAALSFGAARNGRRERDAKDFTVNHAQFHKFWHSELRDYGCEKRLFNVLRHRRDKFVHIKALEAVISTYLTELFRSKRQDAKLPKTYLGIYAKIGTAEVAFGVHAGRATFGLRELERSELCKKLLGMESGRSRGAMSGLKLEGLDKVRREFVSAGNFQGGTLLLTKEEVVAYSVGRQLLTPMSIEMIFARYCDGRSMDVLQFTQFLMAVGDPFSKSSAEYLLPLVDADMNGKVSVADAQVLYKEKASLQSARDVQVIPFDTYWFQLCDHVAACTGDQSAEVALQRREVILSDARVRSFVARSLLFIDDAVDIVDISGTVGEHNLMAKIEKSKIVAKSPIVGR